MCPAPSDLNNLDQGAGIEFNVSRCDAGAKRCLSSADIDLVLSRDEEADEQ